MMSEHYYDADHLKRFGNIAEGSPELAKKFFDYYAAVFAPGALTEREKALIALAVAHTVQCPYCIDAYTTECLQKGSDLEQMTNELPRVFDLDRRKVRERAVVRFGAGRMVDEYIGVYSRLVEAHRARR